MDYPDGFPKHLQPRVDAAIHDAEVDFIKAMEFAGRNFSEYEAILDWIDTIFWPFAEQACRAGMEELWTGQEIRNALEEYLNRLATYAQLEKSSSGPSDSRVEFYIKHVKDSFKWVTLQRKLAGVARSKIRNAKAKKHTSRKVKDRDMKEVAAAYFASFPEKIAIVDVCWAAGQHYREWTRWIGGECKPGLKPDRAFRAILASGKRPSEYRAEPRPPKWK